MATSRTLFAYKQLNSNSRNRAEGARKYSGKKKFSFWKFLGIAFISIILIGIITISFWLQIKVFKNLPDVSEVKDMKFSEATIITDRNGVELYKLFDENREYVDINQISQHMIDAIVAMEDQHYWEHEGLDPWGIFRAAIKGQGGGSTLPQQLMTNVFKLKAGLSSANKSKAEYYMDKVAYKLRQIVLAKRLNSTLQKQVKAENPNLSNDEAKKEMKKKVLELYLNYIEFGNNSFGVEAASKSFFGVSASDLSIAQSAVLASLPKGPGQYSPFTDSGRKKLMGYFKIIDPSGNEYPYEGTLKQSIIAKFSDAINKADFSNKKSSNSSVNLLQGLGSFTIVEDGKEYYITFYNGRKDVVLSRMFEDDYITEEEYKAAEIKSLSLEFKSATFSIKAPHFVFWIKELLEEEYGEDAILGSGLIVKTSLDYNIQKKAEEAFQNNIPTLVNNQANNSSMIYVNTQNGEVLAYVGSLDYFNEEIKGQIDMVRSPRQSGSSIKPLIYALGFMKLPLTLDTPIYDISFQVGPDKPNNADNKFEGMLPLKTALGHSRNIPAIKMFIAEGGENVVKPFLKSLGLPLSDDINYGYPLAIGAAEISLLDFANAYSHLSTANPAEINPILEIKSADGTILYPKDGEERVVHKEDIIPAGVRYLIWKILSDPNNRLAGWVSKFNVSGLVYALKTGTSNMKTEKGNFPRDGLVAAYTPDNLILMRAGNADASPMNKNAYGGTIHAQPLKEFLGWLVKGGYIVNKEMENVDTTPISISKITGKLPAENAPSEMIISTIGYSENLPKEADPKLTPFEYDALCLGVASPLTPSNELKQGYLMQLSSFMPGNEDLGSIKELWDSRARTPIGADGYRGLNILSKAPEGYCENREPTTSDEMRITIIDPETNQKVSTKPSIMFSVKSSSLLKSLSITVDGKLEYTKPYNKNQTEDLASTDLDLSKYEPGNHTITIQAMDANGKMNSTSITVVLESGDTEPPFFVPSQSKKEINEDGSYQITAIFDDHLSGIPGGTIKVNGDTVTTFNGRLASFSISSDIESFQAEVKDNYGNVLNQTINLADF